MIIIYKCIYLSYEFLAKIQRAEEIAEEKGQHCFRLIFQIKLHLALCNLKITFSRVIALNADTCRRERTCLVMNKEREA